MTANQAQLPVAKLCRLMGVSPSGYYAWSKRLPSARSLSDAALMERIGRIHEGSRGTYGAPRIHAELAAEGCHVGRKRVARLMRAAPLTGISRRKFVTTTVRGDGRQAPDLVDRRFTAERPNTLWVADITYVPTWAGFVFLAVVLDAFSRRIVGWSMAVTLHTQVVLDALNMAIKTRRPRDVIHHSDQGTQYTSIEFGKRCREAGVRPSMGSVGDAYDNAMAESFFATLECELLDRRCFQSKAEAKMALFEFIEGFYNPRRRHSSLGYLSPADYEHQYARQANDPGTSQPAAGLGAVKARPGNGVPDGEISATAVLDRSSARRPQCLAGRDEGTGSAGGQTKELDLEKKQTFDPTTPL